MKWPFPLAWPPLPRWARAVIISVLAISVFILLRLADGCLFWLGSLNYLRTVNLVVFGWLLLRLIFVAGQRGSWAVGTLGLAFLLLTPSCILLAPPGLGAVAYAASCARGDTCC
jgi:hypothetical protein